MYNPDHFRMDKMEKIIDLIRQFGFGILFSGTKGDLIASHIPMSIDDEGKVLKGHMAFANNQWKSVDGSEVLAVFTGPNHYISPEWYKEDYAVPTWNYLDVQVRGIFNLIKDKDSTIELLDDLVRFYELKIGGNWYTDWTNTKYDNMLKGLTAFTIDIEHIEGKWKLSQNHPISKRLNVVDKLRNYKTENAIAIADQMEESCKEQPD